MNFAWTEPARARWEALGARERRVASALAVTFGAALFYLLLWSPVESGLARARPRLASVQAQLARVQEQAAVVAKVRARDSATAEGSWLKVIELEKNTALAAQAHFGLAGVYRKQGKARQAQQEMQEFQKLQGTIAPPRSE